MGTKGDSLKLGLSVPFLFTRAVIEPRCTSTHLCSAANTSIHQTQFFTWSKTDVKCHRVGLYVRVQCYLHTEGRDDGPMHHFSAGSPVPCRWHAVWQRHCSPVIIPASLGLPRLFCHLTCLQNMSTDILGRAMWPKFCSFLLFTVFRNSLSLCALLLKNCQNCLLRWFCDFSSMCTIYRLICSSAPQTLPIFSYCYLQESKTHYHAVLLAMLLSSATSTW